MTVTNPQPHHSVEGIGNKEVFEQKPVVRLFEECAARCPFDEALIWGEERMSYQELDHLANGYAQALKESGLSEGDVVALALPRGFDLIAALIGAQKMGGVYLPIDPDFPKERINFMLSDSGVRAVVTSRQDLALWRDSDATLIQKDNVIPTRNFAPSQVNWEEPMYIIYTSGTTGQPKGIIQTHRTISNLIQWQNRHSGIHFDGRVLQYASFGFDVYLQELFSALTSGGAVVLMKDEERLSSAALAGCIRAHQVSTLFLPVSVLAALFEDASLLPDTLQDVVTAGEPLVLSKQLRDVLHKRTELTIHNHYGVSESHVVTQSSYSATLGLVANPTLGRPIANTSVAILAEDGLPVATNEVGELWISGDCLAEGYINLPEKNAELFVLIEGKRWYRTGDFGKFLPNGEIVFTGRRDDQIKLSGHLVVLSEVESVLMQHPAISACVCTVKGDHGLKSLVAHYVSDDAFESHVLREFVAQMLPAYSIPERFIHYRELPRGATGKVDRAALNASDKLDRNDMPMPYIAAKDDVENAILRALEWGLAIDGVGMEDEFSALGLTSFKMLQIAKRLSDELGFTVKPTLFFESSTPAGLKQALLGEETHHPIDTLEAKDGIAIIGMAGLFPGANDVDALWEGTRNQSNLLVPAQTDGQQECAALLPDTLEPSRYIGPIDGVGKFEPTLFGMSAKEALWMDPQQRKFLEQCWHCFEHAGLNPFGHKGKIGVFAGSAESSYLFNVQPRIKSGIDYLNAVIGSDKDFLATRVAYHFDLQGPAINVQSACSTGLLAVHEACKSIRSGECDLAIAGASSILLPQHRPIPYEPNTIFSESGLTRPFDVSRDGTNMTNAVGVVLLKPLKAAIRDGDPIHAVVRGSGINNDGHRKASFSAPSVSGQSEAIMKAQAQAGISPQDVSFIETHGTATSLGDKIELTALQKVFGKQPMTTPCALTSVKANIGHTNRAAGIVGLISATLNLSHRTLPGMANFTAPDQELDLERSSFRVPMKAEPLPQSGPIYAGVSSFGIGGTNVHVVLESAPVRTTPKTQPNDELFLFSAPSKNRLKVLSETLANQMRQRDLSLQSVANTLNAGRPDMKVRTSVVARDMSELCDKLTNLTNESIVDLDVETSPTFALFLGHDSYEVNLYGRSLYKTNDTFKATIQEACLDLLEQTDLDLLHYFAQETQVMSVNQAQCLAPLNLMTQVATLRALSALGCQFETIIGFGRGEIAKAVIEGNMPLKQAILLATELGAVIDATREQERIDGITVRKDRLDHGLFSQLKQVGDFSGHYSVMVGPRPLINQACEYLDQVDQKYGRFENIGITLSQEANRATTVSSLCESHLPIGHWEDWLAGRTSVDSAIAMTHLVTLGMDTGLSDWVDEDVQVISLKAGDMKGFKELVGQYWRVGGPVNKGIMVSCDAPRCSGLPGIVFEGSDYLLPLEARDSQAPNSETTANLATLPKEQQLWHRELKSVALKQSPGWKAFVAAESSLCVVGDVEDTRGLVTALNDSGVDTEWMTLEDEPETIRSQCLMIVAPKRPEQELLLSITRFLSRLNGQHDMRVLLLSENSTPLESFTPQSALASVVVVANSEQGYGRYRYVDLESHTPTELKFQQLAYEFQFFAPEENIVAYRRGRRYVETVTQTVSTPLEMTEYDSSSVILITGGVGNVGSVLSETLAEQLGCRIVLTGRRDEKDEQVQAQLAAIAARGGQGLYLQCDVTQAKQVKALIEQLVGLWGRVDVVMHLAAAIQGVDFLCFLSDLNANALHQQLAPKRDGIEILDQCLERFDLAPVKIAFSSISITLGGVGYIAYVFANRMLLEEGLARGWKIIHWDYWEPAEPVSTSSTVKMGSSLQGNGLDRSDIANAIQTFLTNGYHEAAVFKCAPTARPRFVKLDKSIARPNSLDISQQVQDIWCQNLEVDTLAKDDDFLVLGGDSLSAIGIVHDIRQALNIVLEPNALLENTKFSEFLSMVVDKRAKSERPINSVDPSLSEQIKEIWATNLEIGELPTDADFLELGGDSLSAIGVIHDLRQALNVQIEPDLLLHYTQIDEFIHQVELKVDGPKVEPPTATATATATAMSYRASPLQNRWFHMHKKGYGGLLVPMLFRGNVNPEILKAAFEASIAEFEAFRTIYQAGTDGEVWATVLESSQIESIQVLSVDAFDSDEIKALVARLQTTVIDIQDAAPVRGWLYIIDNKDVLVVLHTHHICFDGWSSSLLLDNVRSHYEQGTGIEGLQPYSVAAARAHEFLDSSEGEASREAMQRIFDGTKGPVEPKPDLTGRDDLIGHKVSATIEEQHVAKLKRRAAQNGLTLCTDLMSSFAILLHRHSGEQDIVFGTTSSGRSSLGSQNTFGVFVNPLPVRIQLDPNHLRDSAERETKEAMMVVQRSMQYPVTDLATYVEPFNEMELNDIFTSYFLFQNFKKPSKWETLQVELAEEDDDIDCEELALFSSTQVTLMRHFELIIFEHENGTLSFNMWGRRALYSQSRLQELLDDYLTLVAFQP
ncbi:amino acid adenylation domain-containing protein [Vibrio cholerae]|nr:amino acid adenylation domain-containing protein [Vibrio cholerae]ELY5193027.1 amino acid adenylation domain-containing protein [Vibrio cholerae]